MSGVTLPVRHLVVNSWFYCHVMLLVWVSVRRYFVTVLFVTV